MGQGIGRRPLSENESEAGVMIDRIISLLKTSGVTAWELSDVVTHGWEFYFIRHELDQNRVKNVETITLKVYQAIENGAYLGSAEAEIAPTASENEVNELIKSLAYRATLVRNRPYKLAAPQPAEPMESIDDKPEKFAAEFLNTMKSLSETEQESINSYEIFVSYKTSRFLSSTGIDVSEAWQESMMEVIVNARKNGHEIELYRDYKSGSCDVEGLRRDLLCTMRYGRDRLLAVPTPPLGTADVLFTGGDAREIYSYFVDRLDAAMVYRRMSDWEPGKPVCTDFQGDRLTLRTLRTIPNSSANRRYDAEGAPVKNVTLIENGVAKNILGNRMYASYLGLEDAFIPANFAVSGGSYSEEELRNGPYLELVEFSDFQVDSMTGDLFGEIRLGYWHDGNSVIPVSGGSVSGSMMELTGKMFLSRETLQYNNWQIPSATLLKGVTVTGIEKNPE